MTELNIIDGQTNNEQIIATTTASVRIRAPKRILHFSDGTLEEYSDDDVDGSNETNSKTNQASSQQVDVHRLEWGPWMIHRVLHTGNRVLTACDYVGEKITAILGITTPKYDYEIKQFKKMQDERAKLQEEEKVVGGWMQATNSQNNAANEHQPAPVVSGDKCITAQDQLQRY